MIIQQEHRPIQQQNINAGTSFSIQASSKAFQILSRQLYSDPVLAIIRELMTNAADSHIRAGKSKSPIKVTLPTLFAQELRVKDWGVGMSHETIHGLYTTFFGSDKTATNDETGALGLGSKSPFSYTDQFSVESRYNGIFRRYLAFINESGFPELTDIGEPEHTFEENGIEVIVPVADQNISDFISRYGRIAPYMPTPPTCNLNSDPPSKPLYTIEVMGCTLEVHKKRPSREWRMGATLVQGTVPYAFTSQQYYDLPDLLRDDTIVLRTPLGHFDIAPSRESLSLQKKDYQKLQEICTAAQNELHLSGLAMIEATQKEKDANLLSISRVIEMVASNPVLFGNIDLGTIPAWRGYDWKVDPITRSHGFIESTRCLPIVPLHPSLNLLSCILLRRGKKDILSRQSDYSSYTPSSSDIEMPAIRARSEKDPIVYWRKNKTGYRHVIERDKLVQKDIVWFITGPRDKAERWAKMYGLTLREVGRAPSQPKTHTARTKTGPKTRSKYEYSTTLGNRTLDQVFQYAKDHPNTIVQLFTTHLQKGITTGRIIDVIVPDHHTKARKTIEEMGPKEGLEQWIIDRLDEEKIIQFYALYEDDARQKSGGSGPLYTDKISSLFRSRPVYLLNKAQGNSLRLFPKSIRHLIKLTKELEELDTPAFLYNDIDHIDPYTRHIKNFDSRVKAQRDRFNQVCENYKNLCEKIKQNYPLMNQYVPFTIPDEALSAYFEVNANE